MGISELLSFVSKTLTSFVGINPNKEKNSITIAELIRQMSRDVYDEVNLALLRKLKL